MENKKICPVCECYIGDKTAEHYNYTACIRALRASLTDLDQRNDKLAAECNARLKLQREAEEQSLTYMRQLYAIASLLGLDGDEIRPSELHEKINSRLAVTLADVRNKAFEECKAIAIKSECCTCDEESEILDDHDENCANVVASRISDAIEAASKEVK